MKKKDYYELLLDPRWQQKKTEILQRDNFTCQHCGRKDRTLHVHHLLYDKDAKPWEYDNKNLITLCDVCHENDTEESRESYALFLETKRKFEEFGFSHTVFNDILRGFSYYIDCAEDGFEEILQIHSSIDKIVEYYLCNSGGISDLKAYSKIDEESAMYILSNMFPKYKIEQDGKL